MKWKDSLHTDEENVNFARQDELNRMHSEEEESPGSQTQVHMQHVQTTLITTWEAGWNVTNAIQVTYTFHHSQFPSIHHFLKLFFFQTFEGSHLLLKI